MARLFEELQSAGETMEVPYLLVIGVGGAGGNAINRMIDLGLKGLEFLAVDTDLGELATCRAPLKLAIGRGVTQGRGADADPEKGLEAAFDHVSRLRWLIRSATVVLVVAGLGGGTGTGAAPVIARIARDEGALSLAVVTLPLLAEGQVHTRNAEEGLAALSRHADTVLTIPGENLRRDGLLDALREANQGLVHAVKAIGDSITGSGLVGFDLDDFRAITKDGGHGRLGVGRARGPGRVLRAVELALSSPLLGGFSVTDATGVLLRFVGGTDMKLREVSEAVAVLRERTGDAVEIQFNATIEEALGDEVELSLIATGFDQKRPG